MTVACCSQTNPTKPSKILKRAPFKAEETGEVWGPGFYQRNISTRWQQLEAGGPELHEKRGPVMPMKAVYFSHKKGGWAAMSLHFFHDPREENDPWSAENLIQICRCEHDFRTWKSPLSRQVSSIIFDPFRCSRKKPESALFRHAKQQKHPLCNIWNKRI